MYKLTQEEIYNLSRPTTIVEIEMVGKNTPLQKPSVSNNL